MMQEGISLKASRDVNLKKKYAGLHLYRIMRVSPLMVYYAACISRNLLSHKANWCVIKGAVLDVAVDIRKGSPTFGKHVAVELTGENHRQFFIPRGFAHGFAVLSDEVLFQYKCDHYYAPQSEGGIAWDDPDLGIDWRLPADKVILSDKDKKHPRLKDYQTDFDFNQSLY